MIYAICKVLSKKAFNCIMVRVVTDYFDAQWRCWLAGKRRQTAVVIDLFPDHLPDWLVRVVRDQRDVSVIVIQKICLMWSQSCRDFLTRHRLAWVLIIVENERQCKTSKVYLIMCLSSRT